MSTPPCANCTFCTACRFGMHAQIGTVREPVLRVEIVSQRQIFDDNPTGFRCGEAGSKEGWPGQRPRGASMHACE